MLANLDCILVNFCHFGPTANKTMLVVCLLCFLVSVHLMVYLSSLRLLVLLHGNAFSHCISPSCVGDYKRALLVSFEPAIFYYEPNRLLTAPHLPNAKLQVWGSWCYMSRYRAGLHVSRSKVCLKW